MLGTGLSDGGQSGRVWPSGEGGGGTGGGVRRAVYGGLLLGAPTRASARTRASRRLAGGGEPRSYRPAGWRAMKPAVEVMLSDQREPVSASATVSKRLPSITMKACSELA